MVQYKFHTYYHICHIWGKTKFVFSYMDLRRGHIEFVIDSKYALKEEDEWLKLQGLSKN